MQWAASHGVPVPELVSVDGPNMVMAAVDGLTLLEEVVTGAASARDVGRVLADLHRQLDHVPPPPWASRRRPDGDTARLLHGDLHPGNVIASDAGPVLIDWTDAAVGDRSEDVAESWLLLTCFDPAAGHAWLLAREVVAHEMVAHLPGGLDPDSVARVAKRRLQDQHVTAAERAAIVQVLKSAEPRGPGGSR